VKSLRVQSKQTLEDLGDKKSALKSLEVAVGTAISPSDFPNTLRSVGGSVVNITRRRGKTEDPSVTLTDQIDYEIEIQGVYARVLVGLIQIGHGDSQPVADIVTLRPEPHSE
jgi:hypothetical protein